MILNSTSGFLCIKGVLKTLLLLIVLFGQNSVLSNTGNGFSEPRVHDAPIFISFDMTTFPENGTGTVIDIDANDGEGGATDNSVSYTLTGDDPGAFNLTAGGLLTFKEVPDYDAPADSDGDNIYRLTVSAEAGGSTTVQELRIVVVPEVEEGVNFQNRLDAGINGVVSGDTFGNAISMNSTGTIMAVGAELNDRAGENGGQVRVYEYNGSGWSQLGNELNGAAAGDLFGHSVSLSYDGTILAVGAKNSSVNGADAGYVKVYRWTGSNWVQQGSTFEGLAGEFMGSSVRINADGSVLATGAPGSGTDKGKVQVYYWNGSNWIQRGADLLGTISTEGMGASMSLSADGLVLAAGGLGYGSSRGTVRVFGWDGISWVQRGNTFIGSLNHDRLGNSVNLSADGSILALGRPGYDSGNSNVGLVSVHDWDGSSWNSLGTISGTSTNTDLGESASLSADGTVLAVSAASNQIRIYHRTGANWSYEEGISGTSYGDGVSLSADGRVAGIGAASSSSNLGLVTAYELVDRTPVFTSLPTADFAENSIGTVLDVNVINGDGGAADVDISYSLAIGGDNSQFNIDEATGIITFVGIPDFELPQDLDRDNEYHLQLTAGDVRNSINQQITITITNVDPESPVIYSFDMTTFPENGTGTVIDIDANDGEGGATDNSVSYTLTGDDPGAFNLTAGGLLTFKEVPDYDAPADSDGDNIYRLTLTVEKTGGSTTVQELRIVVVPEVEEGVNFQNRLDAGINGVVSGDTFGNAISMNSTGTIMAVGAELNDRAGENGGQVRVYEYNGSGWSQLGNELNGAAAGDLFGHSVSLSYDGTILAVGAKNSSVNGADAGYVKVYRWTGSNWVQQGSTFEGLAGEFMGSSVRINADGSVLATGAPGSGTDKGKVQVYYWNGSNWIQRGADLLGTISTEGMGASMSLSADGLVLAAGGLGYGSSRGTVRVFGWDGISWVQRGNTFIGSLNHDRLGNSVNLSADGSILALGRPGYDSGNSNVGLVSVHDWDGSSWNSLGTISGTSTNTDLGESASLSADGTVLAVSAASNQIRIYHRTGANWSYEEGISGTSYGDGVSLSADGRVAGIGAASSSSNLGLVTAYELVDRSPVFTSLPTADFIETKTGTVLDINAEDGDGAAADVNITYSKAVGGDNAQFNLDPATGVLTFIQIPDFEAPRDINGDNVYHLQITASDVRNSISQDIAITVHELNQTPTLAGSGRDFTYTEAFQLAADAVVFENINGSPVESDQLIVSFSIELYNLNNAESETFEDFDGSTISLKNTFGTTANHGLSMSRAEINGVNTMTFTSAAGISSETFNSIVNGFYYNNADRDFDATLVKRFVLSEIVDNGLDSGGNDNIGNFNLTTIVTLVGTDTAPVLSAVGLDPTFTEGGNEVKIFKDADGSSIESDQTIQEVVFTVSNVQDGNQEMIHVDGEPYSLINGQTAVTSANGIGLGIAVNNDIATVTLLFPSGLSDGELNTLIDNLAYEHLGDNPAKETRIVTLKNIKDSGNNTGNDQNQRSITVTSEVLVQGVNDAPVVTSAISASVDENTSSTGYSATASDVDSNVITWSLGTDEDEAAFNIGVNNGQLTFMSNPDFEIPTDNNGDNNYLVEVIASDGMKSARQLVTVTVTNVDDTDPVFTSVTAVNFAENGAGVVHTITTTDESPVSFSLGSARDEANFSILSVEGDKGVLIFNNPPDFENPADLNTDNAYTIEVIATDGVNTASHEVVITVTDVDDIPAIFTIPLSFAENGTGTVYTASIANNRGVIYSLGTNLDESLFSISAGIITFKNSPDFEDPQDDDTNNVYEVKLIAREGPNVVCVIFLITVTDQLEDITPPDAPVITYITEDTGMSATDGVTSDNTIIISGEAEANATVELFNDDRKVAVLPVDSQGKWNFDIRSFELAQSTFNPVAEAIDASGNRSATSAPFTITIDFTAPTKPVITGISDDTGSSDSDGVTNDQHITISGTAEPMSMVEVFTQYGPIRSAQADTNGDWLLDIRDITLFELVVDLTAEAVDLAGNRSATSDIFKLTPDFTAPAKPMITGISDDTGSSDSDGITSDKNIIISGTAEPLSTVEVFTQYGPLRSTAADVNGDWLLDISDITLQEISVNLIAKAVDLAGNRSAKSDIFKLTPDFTAPAKPMITGISDDTGSSDSDGITSDKNIIISGTAEPLSTVEVFTQYGPLRSTGADANGDWLLDISDITLQEISVDLTAKAVDLAGNRSAKSDVFALMPDFTAPAATISVQTSNSGSYTIMTVFSEEVSGLTLGEISVTGGTAGSLVQNNATSYSFVVTLSGSTADVQVNANAAQDVAGNGNTASNQLTLNMTVESAGERFTSLQSQSKTEEVSLFPNPASTELTIDLSGLSSEKVDINMYNAAGTPVFTRKAYGQKTLRLDVSDYTSGMYIVQVYDGQQVIRKKVMVKK